MLKCRIFFCSSCALILGTPIDLLYEFKWIHFRYFVFIFYPRNNRKENGYTYYVYGNVIQYDCIQTIFLFFESIINTSYKKISVWFFDPKNSLTQSNCLFVHLFIHLLHLITVCLFSTQDTKINFNPLKNHEKWLFCLSLSILLQQKGWRRNDKERELITSYVCKSDQLEIFNRFSCYKIHITVKNTKLNS